VARKEAASGTLAIEMRELFNEVDVLLPDGTARPRH
jgi:hypothetical protein